MSDELRRLFGTDRLAESLENVDPAEVRTFFQYFKSLEGSPPPRVEKWWRDEDWPASGPDIRLVYSDGRKV